MPSLEDIIQALEQATGQGWARAQQAAILALKEEEELVETLPVFLTIKDHVAHNIKGYQHTRFN